MIRGTEYLKEKFETGDIPTENDYADLIDSCYNGDASGIVIPDLNYLVKEYIVGGVRTRRNEKLMIQWFGEDLTFLDYNPKIWLYRYKNNKKKLPSGAIIKHKDIVHTPHLNGVNYPNSSFYAGKFNSPVVDINKTGVHTEFEIGLSGNTPFEVTIDPYDWFYMLNSSGDAYKLTDEFIIKTGYRLKVMSRPKGDASFLFRLAITIDNPNGDQQRIVGPITDIIALRYVE
jgi:hypothetical protein